MNTVNQDRSAAARELLDFYAAAGVDAALGEIAVDRLAPAQAPPPEVTTAARQAAPSPPPRAEPPQRAPGFALAPAPASPDIAVMAARETARSAASLDELRGLLSKFEGCALRTTAKQLVFADGNPQARVMFVGEAPGREEDIDGLPFVGRSGKLLDLMIAAIGLDRTSAYIANIIPWRPPGNRTPTPQESADLPAVHAAPDRAREPGHSGLPRRPLIADAARREGRHQAHARTLVHVSHRHARNQGDRDIPPRLSAALAAGEALRLAGFAGDQEGARRRLRT